MKAALKLTVEYLGKFYYKLSNGEWFWRENTRTENWSKPCKSYRQAKKQRMDYVNRTAKQRLVVCFDDMILGG